MAFSADDSFAYWQCGHRLLNCRAWPRSSGVTDRSRALVNIAGIEQLAGFVFIRGRHHQHVRDAAQVGEIKTAGMGWSVFSHKPGAINTKKYIQTL